METRIARHGHIASAIFLVALAIRLAIVLLLPTGYPIDMRGWLETGRFVATYGVGYVYDTYQQANAYPPLYFWPLRFAAAMPDPEMALRLLAIIADAACASLVWAVARTWLPTQRAILAGLLYALNPAALVTVAWMGMIGDPWFLLPLLGAVRILVSHRPAWALPLLTLAVCVKPQALALAPLIAAVILLHTHPRDLIRPLLMSAAVLGTTVLPFILAGRMIELIVAVLGFGRRAPYTHNYADTLWLIVTAFQWPMRVLDDTALVGALSYRRASLLLFGLLVALAFPVLHAARDPRMVATVAAALTLGFFVVSTRMHVNYSFAAFPFLCLLAASGWHGRAALGAATVGCLTNWAIEDVPALHWLPPNMSGIGVQVLVALLYLAAFALVTAPLVVHRLFAHQGSAPPPDPARAPLPPHL